MNKQVRCRIHRGCHEIGGNCVEIESQGKRIVLDIGLPLHDAEVEVPDISGFLLPDSDFLGAIISHPHPDHYGLLERVAEKVQVYMGAAARRIIDVSSFFTPPKLESGEDLMAYRRNSRANWFKYFPGYNMVSAASAEMMELFEL